MSSTVTEEVKTEVKEQVNAAVGDVQKAADEDLDTVDTNARYLGETGPSCSVISTSPLLMMPSFLSLWCPYTDGFESLYKVYCIYL